MAAIDAVRSKLDQPLALGYCNVVLWSRQAQELPSLKRAIG